MYQITYEMAEELIRHLYDKTYGLRKIKDTTPENVQKLFNLHMQVQQLLQQIEADGHDVSMLKQEIQEHISQKYDYKEILVKIDGGVRGVNSKNLISRGACAFMIYGDGELLVSNSYYLGDEITLPRHPNEEGESINHPLSTNMAEYMALIKALDYLVAFNPQVESINIESDSEIVVNQVNMTVTTRVDNLLRLRYACISRIKKLSGVVQLIKIGREDNLEVDALVNECLDKYEHERAEQEGAHGAEPSKQAQ